MERNADGSVSLGYAVPDLNVVAMVRAASQDAAETVLDTAAVLSEGQAAVPFVVGMSVSEAESTVSEASLVLTTTGSGETVTATRPDAGTVLPVGGSVEASLR
jgi:beta-lactam-binding protein with PASTA domain